jgi:hypothetical protein
LNDGLDAVLERKAMSKGRQINAFRNDFFTFRLTTMTTTVFWGRSRMPLLQWLEWRDWETSDIPANEGEQ